MSVLVLLSSIHGLAAKQRRIRREQATRKFLLLYLYIGDAILHLTRNNNESLVLRTGSRQSKLIFSFLHLNFLYLFKRKRKTGSACLGGGGMLYDMSWCTNFRSIYLRMLVTYRINLHKCDRITGTNRFLRIFPFYFHALS